MVSENLRCLACERIEAIESGTRQRMTDIALTVKEVFPRSRLLDFFNRGRMEAAAHQIFRWLGGKTYEEWFEHFEANNFDAKNWLETAVLGKVMAIFYQGMVLEAEDVAQSWLNLSEGEREEYKRVALAIAKRERVGWIFWQDLALAFYSLLVFHNFFKDFELMDKSLDRFVAIIFEAVTSETKIYNLTDEQNKEKFLQSFSPTLTKIQDCSEEQDIEATIALIDSWETKYTTEEMHETLEKFKKGIDEDRKGDRKLFS